MSRPSLADEFRDAFDGEFQAETLSSSESTIYSHGGRTLSLAEEFGLDLSDEAEDIAGGDIGAEASTWLSEDDHGNGAC